MSVTTILTLTDNLPLTCSRSGTCCHGKTVRLNPWELACLAEANGAPGWRQQPACSQYVPDFGCSVHLGRPLACRLYPLGRQRQGGELYYLYQGSDLPCMEGCPEVLDLPQLSVAAYIEGQATKRFEVAQDEYLEVMQNLADSAFALLLESGLAESGDRQTLGLWREMGREEPEQLNDRLGTEWIDLLMIPELADGLHNPIAFSRRHHDLLFLKAQESFGTLDNVTDFRKASGLLMGLALHLGRGLGANPAELAEHWIKTAKEHGALD